MAKQRFHINPKTGEPGICVARVSCRFGGPGQHFPSELDARNAFERQMAREQASFPVAAKGQISKLPSGLIIEKGVQKVARIAPGEYFIADPFVIIGSYDQEGWNDFVQQVENDMGWENDVDSPLHENQPIVGAMYDDSPLIAVKSYNGDGLHWSVAPPRRISSDSGLIAPIPLKIMKKLGIDEDLARVKKMGFVQSFAKEVELSRDFNGNIHFDNYLLISHSDAIPEQGFEALDTGDREDSDYILEERRFKTYQKAATQYMALTPQK